MNIPQLVNDMFTSILNKNEVLDSDVIRKSDMRVFLTDVEWRGDFDEFWTELVNFISGDKNEDDSVLSAELDAEEPQSLTQADFVAYYEKQAYQTLDLYRTADFLIADHLEIVLAESLENAIEINKNEKYLKLSDLVQDVDNDMNGRHY